MANNEALDILNARLARGEITPEQYDELQRRIVSSAVSSNRNENQAPAGKDPVVEEILDIVHERQERLSDHAILIAICAGFGIVAIVLLVDWWLPFISTMTTFLEGMLPKRMRFLAMPIAHLLAPVAAGIIVGIAVWLRTMGDYFARPIPAEKFASLTPAQREAIDDQLEGARLRRNEIEYDADIAMYVAIAGFGGLVALGLYWGFSYFFR